MAWGEHRHPQKVCSTLGTGRPTPREVATLNDRDVVGTVNSTTTVERQQPLQSERSSAKTERVLKVAGSRPARRNRRPLQRVADLTEGRSKVP